MLKYKEYAGGDVFYEYVDKDSGTKLEVGGIYEKINSLVKARKGDLDDFLKWAYGHFQWQAHRYAAYEEYEEYKGWSIFQWYLSHRKQCI